MDEKGLHQALRGLTLSKVAYFPSVGSTNDVVAEWARQGTNGPALAAADEQTRGRGRSGQRWFTPAGAALAFSLLLPVEEAARSTLGRASGLGAVAVCEALEALYSLKAEIKWPNDVLLRGRKTSGILAEAHWTGERLGALILGIGINIAPSSVPPAEQLNFPATSVEAELGQAVDRLELLAAVAERCLNWLEALPKAAFLQAWTEKLAYRGQKVRLERTPDKSKQGELLGLEQDGSLILKLENGRKSSFQVGEIHLRPLVDRQAK